MLSGIPHPDSGSICKRDRYYNARPTQGRNHQNVGQRKRSPADAGEKLSKRRPEEEEPGRRREEAIKTSAGRFSIGCFFAGRRPEHQAAG